MKIGIVSLWWLPSHGGAENYCYRLFGGLRALGVPVAAITGSAESSTKFNGRFAVDRVGDIPALGAVGSPTLDQIYRSDGFKRWCDETVVWAEREGLTHVIIDRPKRTPELLELYAALKRRRLVVGAIHHDMPDPILESLGAAAFQTDDLDRAIEAVLSTERGQKRESPEYSGNSDFALEFDFLITNTHFLKPFVCAHAPEIPRFVLHPMLEPGDARKGAPALGRVTASMVNPHAAKGALNMANIVTRGDRAWTFRILQGAWGTAFKQFAPLIGEALVVPGRVELLGYVLDIGSFFRGTDVFVFPSVFEGYGMVAVEALQFGTPVVATNFPSIVEAVGDGARLVPHGSDGRVWIDAIREVLANRAHWTERAIARHEYLRRREVTELAELASFLRALG